MRGEGIDGSLVSIMLTDASALDCRVSPADMVGLGVESYVLEYSMVQ